MDNRYEMDSEMRVHTLRKGWSGLTHLVTGQCLGNIIDPEEMGAIMLIMGDWLDRVISNGPEHSSHFDDDI